MTIQVGDSVPPVSFTRMTPDGPRPVSSAEFFAGRRIALFSVPGAFTPTCSARHLPGFVERADDLRAKGVDEVACTAVNDVFVMDAWGRQGGVEGRVAMLADGNGDWARAAGLEADSSKFGMGRRARRYSMVVNDGEVEQLFVEGPGEFNVSSADYMLERI